jgi:type I restriction enzyme S subunit
MSFELPANWKLQPLESLCERVSVGHVGETSSFFTERNGVPFIRSQNVRPGKVELEDIKYITCEFHQQSKKSQLRGGDLLIVRVGQNRGDCAVLPDGLGEINCANIVFARPDRNYSDFLGSYFNTPKGRENLLAVSSGSAQLVLNTKSIAKINVPVPPPKEAFEIGIFYRIFDDRIALLRETNATLEAIAQALFKSWFVDFDPVRAKQQGREQEGMDEATAALFPDSFEESELGLVPKGWRVGVLGNLLSLRNERTKPSPQTAAMPYVPIESITAKSPFLQEYKSGEEANSSLILFRKGDVLFGAMRPYFHKVCYAPFDGVTRTTVFTLKSVNPMATGFALFQVYQDATIEYATQHSEGSTIPYAKWSNSLEKMAIVVPPSGLQERFSEVASTIISRANENLRQAQTLANLRDTLLPRLISGQLRLPEAETMIEEAAA